MNSGGCPQNLVRTFSGVCLLHVNNAAGDCHNTEIPGAFRGGLGGAGTAGCDIFIPTWRCFLLQHLDGSVSPDHQQLFWHLCWCLLHVWHRFFILRYVYYSVYFSYASVESPVRHVINTPSRSRASLDVFTHWLIRGYNFDESWQSSVYFTRHTHVNALPLC